EAEGARARDFAAERRRLDIHPQRLAADQRMVEVDFHVEPETPVIGSNLPERATLGHAYRLEPLEKTARRRKPGDARLIDGGDVRRRTPVHDRRLGAVDLDDAIVDAEAAQRCHDMLDRGDEYA